MRIPFETKHFSFKLETAFKQRQAQTKNRLATLVHFGGNLLGGKLGFLEHRIGIEAELSVQATHGGGNLACLDHNRNADGTR